MARKPNYDFERRERERAKAAKKAEKLRAKREKSDQAKGGPTGSEPGAASQGPTDA